METIRYQSDSSDCSRRFVSRGYSSDSLCDQINTLMAGLMAGADARQRRASENDKDRFESAVQEDSYAIDATLMQKWMRKIIRHEESI